MSLSTLLLGILLILLGIVWLGWVVISTKFIGIWALVTGIVILVESAHPITVYKRQP